MRMIEQLNVFAFVKEKPDQKQEKLKHWLQQAVEVADQTGRCDLTVFITAIFLSAINDEVASAKALRETGIAQYFPQLNIPGTKNRDLFKNIFKKDGAMLLLSYKDENKNVVVSADLDRVVTYGNEAHQGRKVEALLDRANVFSSFVNIVDYM